MTADELDALYTELCRTMTALGEPQAALYLARFALLAIVEIDDAAALRRMIRDAAEDLPTAPP
jgi:hypothetical protein